MFTQEIKDLNQIKENCDRLAKEPYEHFKSTRNLSEAFDVAESDDVYPEDIIED